MVAGLGIEEEEEKAGFEIDKHSTGTVDSELVEPIQMQCSMIRGRIPFKYEIRKENLRKESPREN